MTETKDTPEPTRDEVAAMRQLRAKGETIPNIAETFGVSRSVVKRLCSWCRPCSRRS